MKKIVMTMIAALTMTAAMAQQSDNNQQRRAPRKMDAQQMTERMAKELGLDETQKTKVLALNKEYQDVIGGPGFGRGPRGGHGRHHRPHPDSLARQKPDGQTGATEQTGQRPQLTDAQKAEMKQRLAKRKEYDQKLSAILTAEQQQKMQKMQKRGRGGRGPKAQQE